MKQRCALYLCLLVFSFFFFERTFAEQDELVHSMLTITQAGAPTLQQLKFIEEKTEINVVIQRVNDCSPGWVAQQIESGNNTSDLFIVRTNMTGFSDLIRKGYCESLNEEESLVTQINQMNKGIVDAISLQGEVYAIPEMVMWDGSICLLCNPTHPLWSRYNLENYHSISDILNMLEDLEMNRELDEWWLWGDHEDAAHLYNLCVVGSINYIEASDNNIDLIKQEYTELFQRFDHIRQSILKRIDPPASRNPLFYQMNMLDESMASNENLRPLLITPFNDQEEILSVTLNVVVLNPNAPNKKEAYYYLNHILESYSQLQSACLFSGKAEPVINPYEESTGNHWVLSPGLAEWIRSNERNVRVPMRGIMKLFWDNQGLEWEQRYLNGNITINQYIDYLSHKLSMLVRELQ